MANVTCPNCDHAFTIDVPVSGQMVECPNCFEQSRIVSTSPLQLETKGKPIEDFSPAPPLLKTAPSAMTTALAEQAKGWTMKDYQIIALRILSGIMGIIAILIIFLIFFPAIRTDYAGRFDFYLDDDMVKLVTSLLLGSIWLEMIRASLFRGE